MLKDVDEREVRWMAELLLAQARSERNMLSREYVGYSDREWMQSKMAASHAKVQRINLIIEALDKKD